MKRLLFLIACLPAAVAFGQSAPTQSGFLRQAQASFQDADASVGRQVVGAGATFGARAVDVFTDSAASDAILLGAGSADITTSILDMKAGQVCFGQRTALTHTGGGANPIFRGAAVSNWMLSGVSGTGTGAGAESLVRLIGSASGDTTANIVTNAWASGFGAANIGGTGGAFRFEGITWDIPYRGSILSNFYAASSSSGIYVADLSEYNRFIGGVCSQNYHGILALGGNNIWVGVGSNRNVNFGLSVLTGANDAHSVFSAGTLNHNQAGGANFEDIVNGFILNSSYIYADAQPSITIDTSQGILIGDCGIQGRVDMNGTQAGFSLISDSEIKSPQTWYVDVASQAELLKLRFSNNIMQGGGEFYMDELMRADPLTHTAGLVGGYLSNHGGIFRGTDSANIAKTDGQAATCWRDLSYQNNSLVNGSAYPDFETTDLNGVPSAKFTRANSDVVYTSTPPSSAASGTVAAVVMFTSDTGNQVVWGATSATASTSILAAYREDADDKLYVQFTASRNFKCDTTTLSLNVPHVIIVSSSGTTHSVTIDGIPQTLTYSSGVNDGGWFDDLSVDDRFSVGGLIYNSTSQDFLDGCVGAVFIYDTTNATSNPQQIDAIGRRLAQEFKVTNYSSFATAINSGVPNGNGAPVDWSQLQNVPTGFADGSDATGGGGGSSLTVKENNTQVGDPDIAILDFLGADFDVTESPDTEINIAAAAALTRDAEWDTSAEIAAAVSDKTGSGALVFGTSPTFTTPLLGTPTSGTLTNCTGLPQAGTVGLTTADSPQFTGVNLGHATDTTFTRVSAGVAAIEGATIYTQGGALGTPISGTLTNCTGLPVAGGGTGAANLTGIIKGNGTSAFTALTTSAGISGVLSDETGSGALVFGTSPTLTTPDISGAATWADNTRQTFNPGATVAGVNVGSQAGDPSTPTNGDLWYDSTANELTARINGANVTLTGSGSLALDGLSDVVITSPQSNDVLLYNGSQWENTGGVALDDPNVDSGLFWDDSADGVGFFTLGTGLSFNTTTLDLDSDLQSWSSVTRASGFDTFAATPSIANLAAVLTNEGTNVATFLGTNLTAEFMTLIDDTSASAMRTSLGATAGTWGEGVGGTGFTAFGSNVSTALQVTLNTGTGGLVTNDGTATLSAKTLTAPKFASGGFIADANGNELIIFTTTASAVNEWTFANGATGVNPKLTASGETNVGLDFQVKGTGVYRLLSTASGPTDLRLFEDTDNGSNYVSLIAPSSTADAVLTLQGTTGTIYSSNGTDVAVADGGSGASTLTGLLQGNGTSAFTTVTNSTTVGQILRVTGSNTYGWGAIDLDDTDSFTGTLPGSAVEDASTTNSGDAEIATTAEIDTASSSALVMTPGQYKATQFATKSIEVIPAAFTADVETTTVFYYRVPPSFNGFDIVYANAQVVTAGTTGDTTIRIQRRRGGSPGAGGTAVDIFSASDYLDINTTETNSDTGDAGTIDTANDDLATGDFLEVTVTAVSTTKPKGLIVTLEARKP